MTNIPIILYHANCIDGTGAKFAAWKKFGDRGAEYIPVQYNQPVPTTVDISIRRDIYILDFSYPREVLERLRKRHNFVKVIDHHKTAEADLVGLDDCVFDMTKSGAVLAWEHFHPKEKVPDILEYIQDRDLWKWEKYNTKKVITGLSLLEGDMFKWDEICTAGPGGIIMLMKSGDIIDSYVTSKVLSSTKPERVIIVPFMGLKAGMVNATDYASEICQEIYKKYTVEIAIAYFIDPSGSVILSLRSDNTKPDAIDVSEIASRFGGGGHKNAAGCKIDLHQLSNVLFNTQYAPIS